MKQGGKRKENREKHMKEAQEERERKKKRAGDVAQLVEPLSREPKVLGSIPKLDVLSLVIHV